MQTKTDNKTTGDILASLKTLGSHDSTRSADVAKEMFKLGEAMQAAIESQKGDIDRLEKEKVELQERLEDLEIRALTPRLSRRGAKSAEIKGFEDFVRTGDTSGIRPAETKEMSIGGGAGAGGAMVPEVIADQMIARAIAVSPLAGLVRQTPVDTSDYVRLVNLRGATASWSSETGARNATATPTLREVRPTHGELFSYPAVTNWLLQDSKFSVEAFLQQNVSDQFGKSLETAILTGDGTNMPTGILDTTPVLTADGASPERDQDAIQYIAGTADLADDVIELYFSLKPEYRRNARFVMSSATLAAVRKLRDANGSGFLWQANLSGGIDAGDGMLVGKPVATSEDLPIIAASPANDAILCGDFQQGYELTRIGPMILIRDQVTVPGKTKLYIAQRFGGRLTDNDAIKALRA